MPTLAVLCGAALMVLGVGSYLGSGMVSWTALIPAFFGLPLLVTGWLGTRESWRKHAMHVAAALALLGLVGSARGVPQTLTLVGGGEVERPGAAVAQAIMALICLVFVVMSVRSFVLARRAQASTAG